MNLHSMAVSAIATVNPLITATLRRGLGYVTAVDGSRKPTYTEVCGKIQVQGIPSDQMYYLDQQGIQGNLRTVYLYGNWHGIVKADQSGGDILIFGGYEWLIIKVNEAWPDWSAVTVVQQDAIT